DIRARVSQQLQSQTNVVYLNVFHRGEWKPIDWAPVENGIANFKKVGKSVLYSMSFTRDKKNTIIDDPFLLRSDGTMQVFNGNEKATTSLTLRNAVSQWTPKGVRHLPAKFLAGSRYILYHMTGNWKQAGVVECNKECDQVVVSNVPENRVYILVNPNPINGEHPERIFTVQNGKQYWW
ncbi:MAG: hypothetical protein OEM52_15095, partial [bacterium]|nr:hypothetical protein [bacterium]